MSIGKEHAKWSPCAAATFKPKPIVRIDNNIKQLLSSQQIKEIKESCPEKVFGVYKNNDDIEVIAEDKCMFCEECIKKAKLFNVDNLITIDACQDKFQFSCESTGALHPKEIISEAFKILNEKMNNI